MPVETLDSKRIEEILSKTQDGALGIGGALGTIDADGKPYVVPMGFKYVDDRIYMFCDKVGDKVRNMRRNPYVCFEVILREYGRKSSVIARGRVEEFKDDPTIIKVWGEPILKLMRAYSPGGAYFKITPEKLTGKSYTSRKT